MIPTIWMYGHQSESIASSFHDYAGWVMLGIAFWLLKSIIDVLRWALVPVGRYTLAAE
jgi:succinate dehydrogenase/fumarate reductase cytochrome b subunit